jgi:hypothetical protein
MGEGPDGLGLDPEQRRHCLSGTARRSRAERRAGKGGTEGDSPSHAIQGAVTTPPRHSE